MKSANKHFDNTLYYNLDLANEGDDIVLPRNNSY